MTPSFHITNVCLKKIKHCKKSLSIAVHRSTDPVAINPLRVFSAYVKEIEEKPEATCWGKKMPFGAHLAEFSNRGGGWVHSISFSPSGNKLAWVGHDASISVVNQAEEGQ